ncbi:hypothetical protein [Thermoanaerobaculum aquaticum]|nr:hypothetical protein [Thermoanaerobaculum aquaticum]
MASKEIIVPTLFLWLLAAWCLWISGKSFRVRSGSEPLSALFGVVSGARFWPDKARRGYLLFSGGFWLGVSTIVCVFELLAASNPTGSGEKYAIAFLVLASYWNLLEVFFARRGIFFVPLFVKFFGAKSATLIKAFLAAGSFFQLWRALGWSVA